MHVELSKFNRLRIVSHYLAYGHNVRVDWCLKPAMQFSHTGHNILCFPKSLEPLPEKIRIKVHDKRQALVAWTRALWG
jgi:hypothetical protein